MPDIYLPNIIKLELTNFSLYCEQSVVMDFSKPVSCLMGANGIGKSTLLNCVNFAITGRINPTNKKLKSIDTLDRGNNYYLQYFDGRISEVDKDYASTRIVFMLGNKRIEVVRNFFPDNSILEYKLDNETQDPRNYEDDVVRLANLNNYAQFVFLQLKSELSKYGYQLDAAHKLFRFITSIFERTPPELITWKFKVIMPVGDWDFSQKIILNFHRMNEVFTSECAFIIVDSNLYLIEPYEADYSGRDHICYQYNAPQNESLTIKDKQFQLSEYYDSAITSIFAQPTYKELDEAMDYYNTRYVRDSSCAVLSQIWTDEAKREFVQKPEHFMRDSLWQCLQNILRNHTVKREQIVDATHPVDIKVTWPAINNVALIEVKWLGDSGQTQYRDARANEGAKQLIDYLASSVQEEPDKHFVGYLTVFDGRRGKTSNQYERQEINYRSEYSSHPSMNYRRFYMAECV